MIAPCGKPMKASRLGGAPAGVAAHAVAAGFIASSSGSAMLAPTPFNTVRREMCFLNRLMSNLHGPPEGGHYVRLMPDCPARRLLRHPAHPELIAVHDRLHDRRKPVVARRRTVDDAAHRGHVPWLEPPAGRVRQQTFGERLRELLRLPQERVAHVVGAVDRRAVG